MFEFQRSCLKVVFGCQMSCLKAVFECQRSCLNVLCFVPFFRYGGSSCRGLCRLKPFRILCGTFLEYFRNFSGICADFFPEFSVDYVSKYLLLFGSELVVLGVAPVKAKRQFRPFELSSQIGCVVEAGDQFELEQGVHDFSCAFSCH